jgi:hypothetical protein
MSLSTVPDYSADFLNIELWADPSVVAATPPSGLDPDPSADGHANALFYYWQFCAHLMWHSAKKVTHILREVAISRSIATLINAEALNLGFQGCARDPELRGSTLRARNPAMSLGQGVFNDLSLVIR